MTIHEFKPPGKNKVLETGAQPPDPPNMEPRIAVLEEIACQTKGTLADLKNGQEAARSSHDRDFRIVFAAIITSFLILASALLYGYCRLDDKLTDTNKNLTFLSVSIAGLSTKMDVLLSTRLAAPSKR